MNIDVVALMQSFQVMGQGMLGIFVVLIVISLIVLLLSKVTNRPPKNKEKNK